MKFCDFSQLSTHQKEQYQMAIPLAFPEVLVASQHIKNHWPRLEQYFPETQIFLLDGTDKLIGFMNAIPLRWDKSVSELPQTGWDWMLQKGIEDYENKIKANTLGGLQVIVLKEHQQKGYSKLLLAQGKKLRDSLMLHKLIIPIRPILKSQYPRLPMDKYLALKKDNKIFDPWIRTHLNCGARLSHVCSESMNISGDINFWEAIIKKEKLNSGYHLAPGVLNSVNIQREKDFGVYKEENIWLYYD